MLSLKCIKTHPVLAALSNEVSQADLFLGANNHTFISTHKFLLASVSPLLSRCFHECPVYPPTGLIIPDASGESLSQLIDFLRSDETTFADESSFHRFLELMQLLGIDYVNWCFVLRAGSSYMIQPSLDNIFTSAQGAGKSSEFNDEVAVSISENGEEETFELLNETFDSISDIIENGNLRHDRQTDVDSDIEDVCDESVEGTNVKQEPSHSFKQSEVFANRGDSIAVESDNKSVPLKAAIPSVAEPPTNIAEVMLPCQFCEKCFASNDFLLNHMKHNHSEGQFKCAECLVTFVNKQNLNRHVKAVHNKQQNFQCLVCTKRFGQKQYLERHYFSVHCKLKPFTCDHCHQSFSQKHTLERHFRCLHTSERPFCCSQCGKQFNDSSNLHRHRVTVHSDKNLK